MKTLTILVDNREKKPLIFPEHIITLSPRDHPTRRVPYAISLKTRSTRMEVGDYLLEEAPDRAVVERKASMDEVATNCLNVERRKHFVRELTRMNAEFRNPLLLMEMDPTELVTPTRNNPEPGLVLDAFQRLLLEYRIPLHLVRSQTPSQRRACGEWVARFLVNAAITEQVPEDYDGTSKSVH